MNKTNRVLLLSHDFGGGFNLFLFSKYKLKNFIKDYYFIGPSKKILNSKQIKNLKKLNFKKYTKIYYSLSWNKKIEKLIQKNKNCNKFKSYLVLDGWGDYKKKIFHKTNFIPDNIICLDKFSFRLSIKQNLDLKSKIIAYPDILFKEYKRIKSDKIKKIKLLYLTSPIIKKNKINMIKNYISKYFKGKVEVRYHPKNSSIKNELLSKKLKKCEYVFGHYSSALIYSSVMGVKSFSINHTSLDIFKWKKLGVFSNFKIGIIEEKQFNLAFKKIKDEYI